MSQPPMHQVLHEATPDVNQTLNNTHMYIYHKGDNFLDGIHI